MIEVVEFALLYNGKEIYCFARNMCCKGDQDMRETRVPMMPPWLFIMVVKEIKNHYKSDDASVGNSLSTVVIDWCSEMCSFL